MSSTLICSTCSHYSPLTLSTGNCKLNPPTVLMDNPGAPPDILYQFPVVNSADEACGRWASPSK